MPRSESARIAAERAGALDQEGRMDHNLVADRIIAFLYSRKGGEPPFVEEICQEVFQSDDPELRAEIAQICSLSAEGRVQKRLNGNGHMLCGDRVRRTIPLGATAVTRTLTVRFVTDNPEEVLNFLVNVKTKAIGRAGERYSELLSLAERRLPDLKQALNQRRVSTTLRFRALLSPSGEDAA